MIASRSRGVTQSSTIKSSKRSINTELWEYFKRLKSLKLQKTQRISTSYRRLISWFTKVRKLLKIR